MKSTLTFNDLSQLLIERNPSLDKVQAETFINSFFRNIASALHADQHVTIDGLGTFTRDLNNNVTFVPDGELAEKVNEPFSFFEAVELDDRFDDADEVMQEDTKEEVTKTVEETVEEPEETMVEETMVEEPVIQQEPHKEEVKQKEPQQEELAPEPAPEVEIKETIIEQPKAETETVEITEAFTPVETTPEAVPASTTIPVVNKLEEPAIDNKQTKEKKEPAYVKQKEESWHFPWWIAGLAGLFIGFAIGYGINLVSLPTEEYDDEDYYEINEVIEQLQTESNKPVADADTVTAPVNTPAVEAEPVKETVPEQKPATDVAEQPRTDMVKAGYYLTSMARKYYGKTDFWCYIYEENKAKLGNPNKIAAGTEVVIPPAEKYAINKDDAASVKRAKAKIAEINARFK